MRPTIYDTETVTFRRYGVIYDSGDEYVDYDSPVAEVVAEPCAIEQGDSREEHERASEQVAAFTVWAPINLDIRASDEAEFMWCGRSWSGYQVDGRPMLRPDPTGYDSHQLVSLVKRESERS